MRQNKIQGVRFMLVMICVGLGFAISTAVEPSWAQTQGGKQTETASSLKPATVPKRLSTQLQQASDEYKSNLEQLLSLYEADAQRAEERLPKMKELLAQGLVTRREVDTAEDAAARTREKVTETQTQLKSTDVLLAEALIEADAEESARKLRPSSAPRVVNTLIQTTAYIRYGGVRAWSLSEADVIKEFFIRRFSRALPIGAFGQSALHNRWGYDHRNAMDVGVSPDTAVGQALVDYLRANGIPFTAFYFAVPGKATGPHIHIGLPSHRIAPMWVAANARNISRE
ncbi:MAG: TolC family protein [Pyrinomonadaceae bacterium]|nr:TolC family protein [Pyrinomonadaceae bacterium]